MADPERIGQVVTNYLTNAFRFSSENRPVDVRVQLQGRVALVSIRDGGPGLSAADQERVWDRFYQSASIERLPGSDAGLGLRLYICRMIVEQHQGKVGVESSVGNGSTFWFTLPLYDDGK
jgi:signal transduction histidine kinase